MKKLISIFLLLSISYGASAQVGYGGNKITDNWYVGLYSGFASQSTHTAILKRSNVDYGFRVGRWETPMIGFAIDLNLVFSDSKGYFDAQEEKLTSFMPTLFIQTNLTNLFGGYKGIPRKFEIISNFGLGYMHSTSSAEDDLSIGSITNAITQEIALDFVYNFGKNHEWQVFLEPKIAYFIAGAKGGDNSGRQTCGYDLNYSFLSLNLGINYKFKNSTKRHNFTLLTPCTNEEEEALNAEINALRGRLAEVEGLQEEIDMLRQSIREKDNITTPVQKEYIVSTKNPNLPAVFFKVGSSEIPPAQMQNVAIAAEILKNHPEMKLEIKGYASPEGNSDGNNVLSQKRAEAVKNILVNKYHIRSSRILFEGCGATEKLFPIYEFNRVSMLYLIEE